MGATTFDLNQYQSAAAERCGSCNHFLARDPGDGHGLCCFKLPPWALARIINPDECLEVDPRTVRDTDTCSFYQPKTIAGECVTFVQKRSWRAGEPQST